MNMRDTAKDGGEKGQRMAVEKGKGKVVMPIAPPGGANGSIALYSREGACSCSL
jgi:hypothetical protein